MVNNFYQNRIEPTINKTKYIFDESKAIPISTLTGLIGSIVVMIILNSSYPIFNSEELDVLVIGNALIGFLIFSFIFTVMTSIAVVCIFSIIIAPPTKKQLVELKDACVDYARIFRTLRVQRYELNEERLKKLFDSSLERKMKEYDIKSLKEIGVFLTKAHNLIESQNKIISGLNSRVESLENDKKKRNQLVNDKTLTKNTSENTKPVKDSNKIEFLDD